MKYLVQLKYTNPSHEHVSLRRRVDTVNRIVEAATEEEAINRIARQQRALGYLIREAKVIESDAKKEKEQLDEEVERIDEMEKDVSGPGRDGDGAHFTGSRDKKPIIKMTDKQRKESERMAAALSSAAMNHSKLKARKKLANEEVGADKRDAGYKMSPAVRKAQAESDRLSKVEKPVQAGTLAAQRRRQAMKTEAMDPNESKGEKKIVKTTKKAAKAAQKMVNAAKGRMNKINIQPTMDIDVKSK